MTPAETALRELLAIRERLEAAIAVRDSSRDGWQAAKAAAVEADDALAAAIKARLADGSLKVGVGLQLDGKAVKLERAGRGHRLVVIDLPGESG